MAQANATYSAHDWMRRPWHRPFDENSGVKMFRLEMFHRYEGDIQGEGAIQYLVYQRGEREVNFVGFETVIGRVGGKVGSFVFQRIGIFADGRVKETVTVVPGSGTGELSNFSGQTGIEHTEHQESYSITLEYEV